MSNAAVDIRDQEYRWLAATQVRERRWRLADGRFSTGWDAWWADLAKKGGRSYQGGFKAREAAIDWLAVRLREIDEGQLAPPRKMMLSARKPRPRPGYYARTKPRDPGLERAIAKAAGVTKLAKLLGRHRSFCTNWSTIPAWHVPRLSELLDMQPAELRPDLATPEALAAAIAKKPSPSLNRGVVAKRREPMVLRVFELAGGRSQLAALLGIDKDTVGAWKKRVPDKYVLAIEKQLGIPAHELRPDLYRRPPREARPVAPSAEPARLDNGDIAKVLEAPADRHRTREVLDAVNGIEANIRLQNARLAELERRRQAEREYGPIILRKLTELERSVRGDPGLARAPKPTRRHPLGAPPK